MPGSIVSGVADATSITAVNFTGVTESALAAGDHSAAIAYNCVSGTADSASGNQVGAVTSIVLG